MRASESALELRAPSRGVSIPTLDRVAWSCAAALLAVHAGLLWRYAVDWPLHDDFTQILAIPGYLAQLPTLSEKVALLTGLALEHRAATIRVAGWIASALPGGIDFAALIATGNALAIGAGVITLFAYPREYRALAALLAAVLLTSVTHYAAQYHATGALQHFGVAFYATAALFALARGHRLLPAALAVAAVFTSASGLLLMTCAAVLSALQRRSRDAIAWAVVSVVVMAAYFGGYEGAAGASAIGSLMTNPLHLLMLGFGALGCIGYTLNASVVIGVALVMAWGGLLASNAWRRVPPFIVAATLFFALASAAIAVGRAGLGVDAVLISRYRIGSALIVLFTLSALAWTLSATVFRTVQATTIVAAAALYWLAWQAVMPSLVDLSMMQRAMRDHYAVEGSATYEGYTKAFGDFTLGRARERGYYRGMERANPPARVIAAMPPTTPASGPFNSIVHRGERVVSARGWLMGRHPAVVVWLHDDARAFRADTVTSGYRGPAMKRRTAFRATVDLDGIPAGRYRIGIAGREDSGVHWTADYVDVR